MKSKNYMTLKGKQNHYNVKFLKGYGHSVSLKDNKIILKNGLNPFSDKQEKEEWFITNLPYEKIVLSGKGYVSTESLSLLNQKNVNLILVDTFGNPVSLMNGLMNSFNGTKNRMAQYDTFRDPHKCIYLQRQIVKAKLQSQIDFLKYTQNESVHDGIAKLESYLLRIDKSDPLKIEGSSSNVYFANYTKLIPARHGFTSRNNSHQTITKMNASDPINALLNYGYSVLAGEISKFVCGYDLDPYFGFYHKRHGSFPSLVYDMMEPFRWLVDYSVYVLANFRIHRSIRKKDYAYTKNGLVVLDSNLIRRFLEILERKFQKERRYAYKFGAKTSDGLKSVQEITVAKSVIFNLIKYCTAKQSVTII